MITKLIALAIGSALIGVARKLKGLTLVDIPKTPAVIGAYVLMASVSTGWVWLFDAMHWSQLWAWPLVWLGFGLAWMALYQPGFTEINGWKWHPSRIAKDFTIRSPALAIVTCVITWSIVPLIIVPLIYPATYAAYWTGALFPKRQLGVAEGMTFTIGLAVGLGILLA